ncbi:hypothetical protein SAMN04487948_102539 [Halogranum amylolyticum]|uniref:Uncharacterized protein n=1 Tax=Halogranum amylolyticum TaxID=660520 RepID=A0A1H8PX63_9EURY|nr:hypothetical protein [Halogranum amylolyticum]SEO46396.1 hypothetical protein SAMN04487948_102539 [Halogranum amylolyticum]
MTSGIDDDIEADADTDTDLDTQGDEDISTANTMRERADESRLKLKILLSANRLLVTGVLALVFFVVFMILGQLYYPSLQTDLQTGDTIETLFSTMLGAIITGTTLIVTISQLVISQENGPLGDQHERMSSAMDFRSYTSELLGRPVPVDPSAFLRLIVDATQQRASALRDAVADTGDEELKHDVDEFTDSLTGNADEVRDQLDGAQFGSFDVLFAALNFNYGWKIFQVERIAYEHDETLSNEEHQLLEELKTTLSMFGPAREHIKTLYFQWALIDLSQLILYVSLPALVVTGGMLAFVGDSTFTGVTLGIENILWIVDAAFTISLLPFLLLVAYIARIATIAKRTLAIGPLILRDSQR